MAGSCPDKESSCIILAWRDFETQPNGQHDEPTALDFLNISTSFVIYAKP